MFLRNLFRPLLTVVNGVGGHFPSGDPDAVPIEQIRLQLVQRADAGADRHFNVLGLHLFQMFGFLSETFPRGLSGAAVGRAIALLVQPFQRRAVERVDTGILSSSQETLFYVVDEAFYFAFGLRIAFLAKDDRKTGFPDKRFELRHQNDISVMLADDEHFILIVQDRLRSAAEEAEGVIVRLDCRFRPERLPAKVDKPHPAVRQHHAEEVHADVPVVHIFHLELSEIHLRFMACPRGRMSGVAPV